jgi:putative glycosyltransferase (TIGR04348 family)
MQRPKIVIISPSLADANNGNWRTAHRWQQLLQPACHVKIVPADADKAAAVQVCRDLQTTNFAPDIVIALHARRSYASVAAANQLFPSTPIVVALTGTDLYNDLANSAEANASLDIATALIVLQEDAIQYVPVKHRHKTRVVFQSARSLTPAEKTSGQLNCVVVGHLRAEKSPQTIFEAVARLATKDLIHITHIGAAHGSADAHFTESAKALSASSRHYRWVGPLPHGLTRAAIKRSHVLIHPSVLEGGANVIVEAITAGTCVIASKMSGNVGMLGPNYSGYFPVGDAAALVDLLRRCLADQNQMTRHSTACKARAALFTPSEEARRLARIVSDLLGRA